MSNRVVCYFAFHPSLVGWILLWSVLHICIFHLCLGDYLFTFVKNSSSAFTRELAHFLKWFLALIKVACFCCYVFLIPWVFFFPIRFIYFQMEREQEESPEYCSALELQWSFTDWGVRRAGPQRWRAEWGADPHLWCNSLCIQRLDSEPFPFAVSQLVSRLAFPCMLKFLLW